MAGLWGCRNGILRGITKSIIKWNNKEYYTTDQDFLRDLVYNNYIDEVIIHDDFHKKLGTELDIKVDRNDYEFLGDTFDENDQRVEDYWKIIKNYK
jgi:hypothetical protein